jgi:hypothetical protein
METVKALKLIRPAKNATTDAQALAAKTRLPERRKKLQ